MLREAEWAASAAASSETGLLEGVAMMGRMGGIIRGGAVKVRRYCGRIGVSYDGAIFGRPGVGSDARCVEQRERVEDVRRELIKGVEAVLKEAEERKDEK